MALWLMRGCVVGLVALAALSAQGDADAGAASPGLVRLAGHQGEVTGVAFGRDGQVYSCGRDGTLRVWSVAEAKQCGELKPKQAFKGGFADVAVSDDLRRVAAVGGRGFVCVWDAEGRPLAQWQAKDLRPTCIDVRADGGAVAVGDQDGKVVVFDVAGRNRVDLAGHKSNILALQWSHAGAGLASGDSDGTVNLWDVAGAKATRTFKPQRWFIGGLAWSPDDERIATCSKTRAVCVHAAAADAADPEPRPIIELDGDTKLYGVVFSHDGALVASGGREDYIKVWRVADGALVDTLRDPQPDEQRGFCRLSVSADGKHLVTAHVDGVVRVWPMPQSN